MNAAIRENQALIARNQEARQQVAIAYGLPVEEQARHNAETAATALLGVKAALTQPDPVFRRLRRRIYRLIERWKEGRNDTNA